ncbi:MAG TPA: PBP1A family penicillin-binding protein [Candidatus Sulfopaludibacter sp.]|jgi:penicillin-binding protein 1B|nr:PBP1A family penicillin-binding protein [Candidatus Sulfopaludibacter sp.]
MKIRIPKNARLARFFLSRFGRILMFGTSLLVILGIGTFVYFYHQYSGIIDQRLKAGVFANTAKIYAAPESVAVGDPASPDSIAAELRRSGYSEARDNPIGSYQIHLNAIEVFPGRESYFDQEAGLIKFSSGKISQIVSLQDNTIRGFYQLEPKLITNISGASREKRRFVKFQDIPPVIVQAVTSAEDKRFFNHNGFDPIRIIKAVYVDVKEGRKDQGASTLSMQLARNIWLDQGKRWTRKLSEVIITLQLEQRLTKEQIFEDYANEIYLGSRGSFRIHGFGEGAEAFLGKDLSQITLPEAAELAGMIQNPAHFDPYRHPDRTKDRRNIILGMMRQNGFVTDRDYALATDAPITVPKGTAQSIEAPYFADLVNDTLQSKFQDEDFQNNASRIYTTLDLRLQRAAGEAIQKGMALVDEQIRKQRRFRGVKNVPEPQVALVAIDPHTGAVKALSGGRSYGMSQLNHVLRQRQPGSIFKPFVYAAALDTGVEGGPRVLTPSTIVNDEPTTFYFDNISYSPSNFEKRFLGPVTLREALAHSLNVATVKVAEMVGYQAVVDMANRAGMNYRIHPTPAVALGSYDITPLEAVGAYTMFANEGRYVRPEFLTVVRDHEGKTMYKSKLEEKQVLDPRVAFLVTSLMEEVMRSGTGAGVRSRYNFTVPAAGKTGTSRDGWFAGYTSELLCVVWVGFDDNSDLDLQGAYSAAPIWGEFMKKALDYREYRDTKPFRAPDGIVTVDIDPLSGMLATPSCPKTHPEVYIAGTEPVAACPLHGGRQGVTNVAGWETAPPAAVPAQPAGDTAPHISGAPGDGVQTQPNAVARRAARQIPPDPAQNAKSATPAEAQKKEEKPGILKRLLKVFK